MMIRLSTYIIIIIISEMGDLEHTAPYIAYNVFMSFDQIK